MGNKPTGITHMMDIRRSATWPRLNQRQLDDLINTVTEQDRTIEDLTWQLEKAKSDHKRDLEGLGDRLRMWKGLGERLAELVNDYSVVDSESKRLVERAGLREWDD